MLKHRRNNAAAGIVMLLAAVAFLFGSIQSWALITIPQLDIKAVQLNLRTVPDLSSDDDGLQMIIQVCAGILGVLALALILTRVRGLGVLWRMLFLICWILPAGVSVYLWLVVLTDPVTILEDPSVSTLLKAGAVVLSGLINLGLVTVSPGLGLYILSAGTVLGLVGLCIPAGRSSTPAHITAPAQYVGPTAPAGWYDTPNGKQYWDGGGWHPFSR